MARVTTIFAMSLTAATALASGSGSSLGGRVSLGENESGLAGLRQSSTGSMLDIDAVVGRSPFQQQQQPGGTSTANIAVSITPAPTAILNNRQLPAPLPAPGGGGGRQPLPNPDTGSAASALASLSAQSSSDVAKASTEGFASGSSVAAAQASSQIASISASLAASLSSAIASITATATPGQQAPITLTVTQTVTGTAAPAQQPPATVTQTQTQTQTETASATVVVTSIVATASMNAAQPDLLPAAPTTSNGLISDPTKDPNLVDLTVSQLAAVIIGTIIGTALAAVLLTLFLTRFAQRRKGGGGQVYENEQDDSGSQAALRPTYVADEKGGAAPTEQHPAVRTKSHKSNPSESSQRISVFDERPPAGAETAGFGFGPFNWSNVRSSIFGSKSTSPSQSRPQSGQVEFRTAHKRTISNGSKPRLIRLGSRDDRLTPVTEKSHESQAVGRSQQQPGGLVPMSGPPSREMSTSPLNLNPPNAPFRNPSGDAVSWGSWGVALPDPGPKDHMEVLLKQPPRHQHTPSSSSSGSSKIMDANQLQAAMAADGTIDPPPSTRQPSKHERRPSSGTLGVMGSNPNAGSSSRLDGPPDMPYPLPSFAPYEQRQQQPPQGSYWSPTVTTSGTDTESPVSSIGALKAFPHPPANVRRSVHGRVQSTSSSRYSAYTAGDGLDRHLSQQSVDSSHRRSASVNSFLLTSNTIHTNGATFSLFPAPAHGTETPPPPMPTRSLSNASAAAGGRRQPAMPRAISAVAPPMPPLALGGPPSPPALPRGVRSSRPRGSDMV
ncbi:hypothetical protein PG985_009675 [Apiospora marii]|uniref:uncharacterized protein n=1 Tax=Apiospora marii TaxID=335849 RepID=UPI003130F0D9